MLGKFIGIFTKLKNNYFYQKELNRIRKSFKLCGDNLNIYGKPSIIASDRISLGSNVTLNDSCILNATCSSIEMGNNIVVSSDAKIMAATLDPIGFLLEKSHEHIDRGIIIGDNTWICTGAIICPGVRICGGVIIAAGAVVTKDIEESNVIVGGNPAHIIKRINE